MDTSFIKGIIVPILTPVDQDENVDEARLRSQVDFVIDHGVHGILAFGSNGEFYMFQPEEMERTLRIILDQTAHRVPVFSVWAWSAPSPALHWQKWRSKRELTAFPSCSPCF